MARLEAAGRPTVVVTTDEFETLSRQSAESQGLAAARLVRVAHPIGGTSEAELARRAEAAIDATLEGLANEEASRG